MTKFATICPVCHDGTVASDATKFRCSNPKCRFTIYRHLGPVTIDEETAGAICRQGESPWIDFRDHNGNANQARVFLRGRTLLREDRMDYVDGHCPLCGGGVVITSKGFSCANHLTGDCKFHIPGILANRKLSAEDVADFLRGAGTVLDGFSNEKGVTFSGILTLNRDQGIVYVNTIVGPCPLCGGNVRVGPSFYACDNFAGHGHCTFKVYRDIAHHAVTHGEIREIITNGCTGARLKFYRSDGTSFRNRLGIDANGKAIFM